MLEKTIFDNASIAKDSQGRKRREEKSGREDIVVRSGSNIGERRRQRRLVVVGVVCMSAVEHVAAIPGSKSVGR